MAYDLTYFEENDLATGKELTGISRGVVGSLAQEIQFLTQASPVPLASQDNVDPYCLKSIQSEGGAFCYCSPHVYDGAWDSVGIQLNQREMRSNLKYLTPNSTTEFQATWPNFIEGAGKYAIAVYDYNESGDGSGSLVDPADYTVDYLNGKITLDSPIATGHVLRWQGYWLDTTLFYEGSTVKLFTQANDTNLLRVHNILNPHFDLWSSSTVPLGWSPNYAASCSRVASGLQGSYAMRLTADGSHWCNASQTFILPSALTQVSFIVIGRASRQIRVGVKLGSGGSWEYVSVDCVTNTESAQKYFALLATSQVGNDTNVYLDLCPTTASSQTGWAEFEMCALVEGNL